MEMQRARETVSYREAAYARLDGWMGFAFKEMPSSRVPFTVEILKFPYGRVSWITKGSQIWKCNCRLSAHSRVRWRFLSFSFFLSLSFFFLFLQPFVTAPRWNRLLHKFALAPVYFISTWKGEVYSKCRPFAPENPPREAICFDVALVDCNRVRFHLYLYKFHHLVLGHIWKLILTHHDFLLSRQTAKRYAQGVN